MPRQSGALSEQTFACLQVCFVAFLKRRKDNAVFGHRVGRTYALVYLARPLRANTKLKREFENVGMEVNSTLWNFYLNNQSRFARQKSGAWGAYFSVRDAAWGDIDQSAKDASEGGTAIFVVSRRSGEGNDMGSYYSDEMIKSKWNLSNDVTNGNYLAISPNELSVLKGLTALKEQKKLNSVIVLMNSANPVQCDFLDDPEIDVDALLWCGNLGETGAQGVANVMAGKVSPSGRLSDTF